MADKIRIQNCHHAWAQRLGFIGEDPLFYCLTCDSYWTEDPADWRELRRQEQLGAKTSASKS